MPTRIPLTAYDRLFLAGHLANLRRRIPGPHIFGVLDLSGTLDQDRLRSALAAAMAAHPLTSAHIRCSYLTARAHWRCPAPTGSLPEADALPFAHYDLRGAADPAKRAREILLQSSRELQHPSTAPQVRLLHLCFRDDAHQLVLRTPHYLMDLEGVYLFLRQIGDGPPGQTDGRREWSSSATQGAVPVPPPEYPPQWSRRYLARWRQGLRAWSSQRRVPAAKLEPCAPITEASADFLRRCWPESATAEILGRARAVCAEGALRYTRFFMIALVKALEDLRDELGLTGEAYLLPLPLPRPRCGPRPVLTRNELTIATLVIERRLLARTPDMDAALGAQLEAYTRTGLDEAMWVTMTYAGWMRIRHYRRFMARGRFAPYSAGFSNFRIEKRGDDFLGAKVEDLSAFGMPLIPPGLMLNYCHYADRLNFNMSFFPHLCPPGVAARLADRFAHHVGTEAFPADMPRAPAPTHTAAR